MPLLRPGLAQNKILVVGDSVIWGHYVPPNETLAHYLNEFSGTLPPGRFANLGLDGTHPAALAGLLRHHGAGLSGRTVVLQFNPLWLELPHDHSDRQGVPLQPHGAGLAVRGQDPVLQSLDHCNGCTMSPGAICPSPTGSENPPHGPLPGQGPPDVVSRGSRRLPRDAG